MTRNATKTTPAPMTSVAILLVGRGLLGGAESFLITAAVSWGLALGQPDEVDINEILYRPTKQEL